MSGPDRFGLALAVALALGAASFVGGCGPTESAHARVAAADEDPLRRDPDAADPRVFGELPQFSLVGADGAPFTRADLLGRPVALACIFTTCSGPCPLIGAEMAELQERLRDTDVLLVSLSVDPDIDTPEVLASYAEGLGADRARWRFVTGAADEIERLVTKSFYLPLERKIPGEEVPLGIHVTHAVDLVVLDRAGRIRGYYKGTTPEGVERLEARLRHLDGETVGQGS